MALFDRSRHCSSSAAFGSEPDVADGWTRQQVLTQLGHGATVSAHPSAAPVRVPPDMFVSLVGSVSILGTAPRHLSSPPSCKYSQLPSGVSPLMACRTTCRTTLRTRHDTCPSGDHRSRHLTKRCSSRSSGRCSTAANTYRIYCT